MAKGGRVTPLRRFVLRPLELACFVGGTAVLSLLPVDWASALGGWIARRLGPRAAVTGRAAENLRLALPDLPEPDIARIVAGMWENLGRTAAEYAHLGRIADPASGRVELAGVEPVLALAAAGKPLIFVSAHLANWEVLPIAAARLGIESTAIVREPSNPLMRAPLARLRAAAAGIRFTNKGARGAKDAVGTLRAGKTVMMLIDQKLSDGVLVPLFGHPAQTTPAPAQLARRFKCPIVPVRIERRAGARFRITCLAPIEVARGDDPEADVLAATAALNAHLEAWIWARPEQWFWLHRRWPKAAYAALRAERGGAAA